MLFICFNHKTCGNQSLKIREEKIEKQSSVKFLGIIVDDKLYFPIVYPDLVYGITLGGEGGGNPLKHS